MSPKLLFTFFICFFFSISVYPKEPLIDFKNLKNPIYYYKNWAVKDPAVIYKDKTFYLFFSAFYFDDGMERSHIVCVKTQDFKTFSEPLFSWRGENGGWIGMASPSITKIFDTYYLTYNSWGDKKGKPNQLFYATSKDLEHWENDKPLAHNITAGKRAIDAELAFFEGKYYLLWKEFQTPQIASSYELDSGWQRLGRPARIWFENGEFIQIDGKWHMLVTRRDHLPYISRMKGDGKNELDWLNWTKFTKLNIPMEEFNTNEKANCAYLLDLREYDDFFYLIYAGRTEARSHLGRGDTKLGISRSKDLSFWEVP